MLDERDNQNKQNITYQTNGYKFSNYSAKINLMFTTYKFLFSSSSLG
jgi:hypothetical protein